MHRFFAQKKEGHNLLITDKKEVHHMKEALRVSVGEEVEVLFENGLYIGKVLEYTDKASIEILREDKSSEQGEVVLLQGTPKGTKLDQILRQATEVGATGFILVDMDRSIAKFSVKKIQRYQAILESATKQSKAMAVPFLEYFESLEKVDFSVFDQVIVCDEEEKSFKIPGALGSKILVVIGPEGGISQKERDYLVSLSNVVCVSLGNRILRTETAGLKALSIIDYVQENQ